ncbi:MAG: TFIIB-type zinc ribbon-containing protein [Candidatus Hodarchaeaceae archaeon]|nr:TFIIB-type zinc ribbon-containing protein [Candidatus Hodarchaeaceae archaeon]
MRCPSCGSSAVLHDQIRGEQICTRCGLVIMERLLEPGPEWRFKPSEGAARADVTAGIDITQHDLGLGSKLDWSEDLSPSWRARLRRLRLWQRRSRASSYEEKSLREALIELDKLCEDLTLPKAVKAEISTLYRKAKTARLTMGRGTWQVLAALTFITCRRRGVARTEGEIVRALASRANLQDRVALRSMRHITKLLMRKLRLEVPRPLAEDYIDRFASKLDLPRSTVMRAHELCGMLPGNLKQTKPAPLLTAAILYVAAEATGERTTIRKLASTLGVGVSSLCHTIARVRELIADRAG